ncbi:MAG: ABC transporter permease [Lachnospiraceae bacterium]|jgi:ABC-type dipeptide/oligopeptide/nickel transport system permease component
MWKYIIKRLLWLILIAICVALLIFVIMWFVPGDPAKLILGQEATPDELEFYRELHGLNDPFFVQMFRFLYDTFIKFDLGTSYVFKTPVIQELATRVPRTLSLGWTSIFLNMCIGIPLGIYTAMHRNSFGDQGLMVLAMVGISMPQFWLALMLVVLFSLKLGWLPPFGIDHWTCWIMPIISCSVAGISMNARQTRAAVLENIRADYVATARAKGLPKNKIIYKHILPNALIPVANQLGGAFGRSISGTVVVETVFAFPGVGTYMLQGIQARDYPIVRSCILVLALFAAFIMLLVDLFYAYLDPRIKAQYIQSSAGKGGRQI